MQGRGRRVVTSTHWGNYEVLVDGGQVAEIVPSPGDEDPSVIGPGMLTPKGERCRVTAPAVRRGWLDHGPQSGSNKRGTEPFVELPWDVALDLAAGELRRVKEQHGNSSLFGGSYGWASAGRFHHAQSQIHRFLAMHGGFTNSVNSYSFAALEVILPHVIGGHPYRIFSAAPQWSEIAESGDLVVAFGGMALRNSQVNPGGVGRHVAKGWQRRCRDAGVEFVNISPLRSDIAADLEPRWIPLRPNTDVALMLALAHTILAEERQDRAFLERCCTGADKLISYIMGQSDGTPKNARWAAEITGIDDAEITALAREIASRRTLISVSWSVQRGDHGEQPYWMAVALAAISGSMGRPGGGFGAGYGAIHGIGATRGRHPVAALPQPLNEIGPAIPVARIADLLLEPGRTIDYDGQRITFPDIRLVYWCGGNPFHHHQDLNRLAQAWQLPETVIVHEHWWTPAAKFADIVFPAATALERADIAAGTNDTWLSPMHKVVEPPPGVRTDYETFAALAERLGFGEAFTEGRSGDEWVRELYERTRSGLEDVGVEIPPFEEFWDEGEIDIGSPEDEPGDPMVALRSDPDAHPLPTPSGKVELFSTTIDGFGLDDCPGHPVWIPPAEWLGDQLAERFPLHLLTNQPATRLHSQHDHGSASQASKVAGREPMAINPSDAGPRGISDGDLVRLYNDRGSCLVGARVTEDVRPGVVQVATGAWYDPRDGRPGEMDVHGNPNVLTLDKGTSGLAQGPSAGTTLVEAERFVEPPPPVRAFEPPRIVAR
jgi:biotin/methionine sulfoxide reductase